MPQYTVIDPNGNQLSAVVCPEETIPLQVSAMNASAYVEGFAPHPLAWWDGGLWQSPPEPPGAGLTWNGASHLWEDVRDLQSIKDQKWDGLRSIRDSKEVEPVEISPGLLFDVDERSLQRRAMALEIATMVGESWEEEWTLADNTIATVTANDLRQIPLVIAIRSRALHETGRILRAQVMSATTIAEVEQISWPS